MEEQQKYIDEIYHFKGKWEMPSLCGLMVRKTDAGCTVILSELYEDNPGSSVTDMIETLAAEIVAKYNIDPENAVFIVRNPERSSHYTFFAETFHLARMYWDGERFSGLAWEKVGGMIFDNQRESAP